jgi:hypothetical protein
MSYIWNLIGIPRNTLRIIKHLECTFDLRVHMHSLSKKIKMLKSLKIYLNVYLHILCTHASFMKK